MAHRLGRPEANFIKNRHEEPSESVSVMHEFAHRLYYLGKSEFYS